ncbi:hypothetical protein PG997_015314 [Apiospora hydei]|uniref:Uncharacterized protein n=1 Tax=Apiospora hydei TaxID=1337664 RepID=A0ABR1UQ99_9PEZI
MFSVYIIPAVTVPSAPSYGTTPFEASGQPGQDACESPSLYCPFIVGEDPKPYSALVCTKGFTTTSGGYSEIRSQMEQCRPPSFFKVFETDANKDIITLAYPGTACLQDWTTACTYDITVAASDDADRQVTTSRQAWCCAPGYQCTTASVSSGTSATFERQCYSFLNTQTAVWASWDPPATGSKDGSEYYTYPTSITWDPPRDKYTVYHKPLPLA